jgi:hypothetical protein
VKDFARLAGLGHADVSGRPALHCRPLAVVQVKENYLMAKIAVARDGAAATVFRVAGMPARHNNLEFRRRGSLWNYMGGTCPRQSNGQGGARLPRAGQYFASCDGIHFPLSIRLSVLTLRVLPSGANRGRCDPPAVS